VHDAQANHLVPFTRYPQLVPSPFAHDWNEEQLHIATDCEHMVPIWLPVPACVIVNVSPEAVIVPVRWEVLPLPCTQ
jgi:hypothetical protein